MNSFGDSSPPSGGREHFKIGYASCPSESLARMRSAPLWGISQTRCFAFKAFSEILHEVCRNLTVMLGS